MAEELTALAKEEAERILREAIKNFDHEGCRRRVEWRLNEPVCCCKSCYDNWLEWGKEIYKDNMPAYEKIKAEALNHLQNRQESRKIDEEIKLQKRMQIYRCSVA